MTQEKLRKMTRRPLKVRPAKIAHNAEELARFLGGHQNGDGWMARCPAHYDGNPSLSITNGEDGRILLHCFAGCGYNDVLNALKEKNIILGRVDSPSNLPRGIPDTWRGVPYQTHWSYDDGHGNKVGHVVRYQRSGDDTKIIVPFFQRVNLDYKPGLPEEYKKEGGRLLYNLTAINNSDPSETIYIVEGEKSAEALNRLGLIATTSIGGSQAPAKTDWQPLSGKRVVIWPDNDRAGMTYASNVYKELTHVGESDPDIHIIEIEKVVPPLPEKGDAFDFVRREGITVQDVKDLPLKDLGDISDMGAIIYAEGEVHRVIDESEQMLMKIDPYAMFNQFGRIVRLEQIPYKNIRGEKCQLIGLTDVKMNFLLDLLNRKLTYLKRGKGEYIAMDPPLKIANRYLARSGLWKLHTLSGLLHAPTILPNGDVLDKPGYHKKTGLLYDPAGATFDRIGANLTREDAVKALKRLRKLFKDFPFEKPEDESVVLAAVLTSLVRKSITNAPLFGFTAPVAGSGKTLLASVVSIIATGRQAVPSPQGGDREEEKKQLFSLLLQGTPVVLIDNIEHPLKSDVLCQILTAPNEIYRDRILGKSEIVEVPTQVTFMATGNNLTFAGDMTRRALLCKIDPGVESPESRTDFSIKNLEEHVHEYRAEYVKDGLTIIKAFIDCGRPKQDVPQYGSFEDWSGLVRESLVWLGMADPNLTRSRVEEEDPIKFNLINIITLWDNIYGSDPVKVADIVEDCNRAVIRDIDTEDEFHELATALLEATGARGKFLNGREVGCWLRRNKERVVNGYKIIIDPKSVTSKRIEWRLKQI